MHALLNIKLQSLLWRKERNIARAVEEGAWETQPPCSFPGQFEIKMRGLLKLLICISTTLYTSFYPKRECIYTETEYFPGPTWCGSEKISGGRSILCFLFITALPTAGYFSPIYTCFSSTALAVSPIQKRFQFTVPTPQKSSSRPLVWCRRVGLKDMQPCTLNISF